MNSYTFAEKNLISLEEKVSRLPCILNFHRGILASLFGFFISALEIFVGGLCQTEI